jgi:hypothetical protein
MWRRVSRLKLIYDTCFHACFLLGLFFYLQDWGDMFLRNVAWLSTDYIVQWMFTDVSEERISSIVKVEE